MIGKAVNFVKKAAGAVSEELFAVDTQHGRFESLNPKNGKHLGEVDFGFNPILNSIDKSGGHNLKMK